MDWRNRVYYVVRCAGASLTHNMIIASLKNIKYTKLHPFKYPPKDSTRLGHDLVQDKFFDEAAPRHYYNIMVSCHYRHWFDLERVLIGLRDDLHCNYMKVRPKQKKK